MPEKTRCPRDPMPKRPDAQEIRCPRDPMPETQASHRARPSIAFSRQRDADRSPGIQIPISSGSTLA
eukprot:972623-Prorocentrum_minimum.AAC.1